MSRKAMISSPRSTHRSDRLTPCGWRIESTELGADCWVFTVLGLYHLTAASSHGAPAVSLTGQKRKRRSHWPRRCDCVAGFDPRLILRLPPAGKGLAGVSLRSTPIGRIAMIDKPRKRVWHAISALARVSIQVLRLLTDDLHARRATWRNCATPTGVG